MRRHNTSANRCPTRRASWQEYACSPVLYKTGSRKSSPKLLSLFQLLNQFVRLVADGIHRTCTTSMTSVKPTCFSAPYTCSIVVLNCPRMDGQPIATTCSPLRILCNTSNTCEISKIAPNGHAFKALSAVDAPYFRRCALSSSHPLLMAFTGQTSFARYRNVNDGMIRDNSYGRYRN